MYTKLKLLPGVWKDDSPLDAEGWFIDADKMRPVRGKYQTIGGWERFGSSTFLGISRGLFAWADTSRNPYIANGTHLRLYGYDIDGNQYDITPVTSRGELTNPFSTTNASATISVAHTSHGLVDNQAVEFPGTLTVGGASLSGLYAVTVTNANAYTFTASSAATTTSASFGGTVDYEYHLAPGQVDGIGGLGYGTGGFGTGGYGSPSSGYALYPRTWSMDNWGQNLIANPRGQAIFEWAPNVSATELVTNGAFLTVSGWTVGANWTITGGSASANNSTATLEQSITLNRAAWHLLDFDMTRSNGSVSVYWGNTTISSTLGASATVKLTFFSGNGGAANLRFLGHSFTGTVDNVSVKVLTSANQIPNAPSTVTAIFTTAERRLVALGVPDSSGNFDPLRVRWSGLTGGQPDNNQWTTSLVTTSGQYILSQGTRIVRGLAGNQENLIWTDTALYTMRFVPDVNVVYRFDLVATGCGLIGPNAVTQIRGVFYWLSPTGEFFQYAGGRVNPMKSTIRRDVFDNLAWVQQDKTYAFPSSAWDEIWWLYPDSRDGNECSRYAMFSFDSQTWTNGTFDRTAWVDGGVFQYPIAAASNGYMWLHEKGFTEGGAARSWSLTSAMMDIQDGENLMNIMGAYPDVEDLQGGYQVTITTQNNDQRGITNRTYGPFNVNSATGKISIRAKGRRAQIEFSGNDAPTFFRMGAFALDMKPSGMKR